MYINLVSLIYVINLYFFNFPYFSLRLLRKYVIHVICNVFKAILMLLFHLRDETIQNLDW